MHRFKPGTPYPIDTVPDEVRTKQKRIMVWVPSRKHWTAATWDADPYTARKPRPFWRMECFYQKTDSRNNQPSHWTPWPVRPILDEGEK